jgi:hypothetical protein
VISDRICGSKAKLIRLHTKRRVLSAAYPRNLSENGGWKLDFRRTESQHTSAPISLRSSVGSDNNPLIRKFGTELLCEKGTLYISKLSQTAKLQPNPLGHNEEETLKNSGCTKG